MGNSTVSSTIVPAMTSTSASSNEQSSTAPSSNDPSASSTTALTSDGMSELAVQPFSSPSLEPSPSSSS